MQLKQENKTLNLNKGKNLFDFKIWSINFLSSLNNHLTILKISTWKLVEYKEESFFFFLFVCVGIIIFFVIFYED